MLGSYSFVQKIAPSTRFESFIKECLNSCDYLIAVGAKTPKSRYTKLSKFEWMNCYTKTSISKNTRHGIYTFSGKTLIVSDNKIHLVFNGEIETFEIKESIPGMRIISAYVFKNENGQWILQMNYKKEGKV